ncbi:MAG: phage tail sheath subtilisin-like domain-containing protein [Deltaproteobacteria bacterium]
MNEPTSIGSLGEFNRIFGGIHPRSEASYAIHQFFLNGGTQAVVVRTAETGTFRTATVGLQDTSGAAAAQVQAISPGGWANETVRLRVERDPNDAATFNLYVNRYESAAHDAKPISPERFIAVTSTAGARFYPDVIDNGSTLVVLTASSANRPSPTGTTSGAVTVSPPPTEGADFRIVVTRPSGSVFATLQLAYGGSPPTDLRGVRRFLEAAIRTPQSLGPGADDRTFSEMTVAVEGDRLVVRSSPSAPGYDPLEVISFQEVPSGTVAAELGFIAGVENNVQEYVLGSTVSAGRQTAGVTGLDGNLPTGTELTAAIDGLDAVDLFNILSIPIAAEIGQTNNAAMLAIMSHALAYCVRRRAFLLVDVPRSVNTPAEMQDWMEDNAGLRSPNSAVYFPRLRQPDVHQEYRPRSVAASGTIAGVYSRTDAQRGVWKAPAGVDAALRGVAGLDTRLTDFENGQLNPLGINAIRDFPIYGRIAWGARTLHGFDALGSEWKYIPIRRLALMIEETLFRSTKWAVFEPNDEPLWAKLRKNIGAFMLSLFRQGAFQGGSAGEAFFVKCDGENNTAIERNNGIVNVDVGFAPLKPAEFVVLRIQQIPDIV